jgi:hypothetical protein
VHPIDRIRAAAQQPEPPEPVAAPEPAAPAPAPLAEAPVAPAWFESALPRLRFLKWLVDTGRVGEWR